MFFDKKQIKFFFVHLTGFTRLKYDYFIAQRLKYIDYQIIKNLAACKPLQGNKRENWGSGGKPGGKEEKGNPFRTKRLKKDSCLRAKRAGLTYQL